MKTLVLYVFHQYSDRVRHFIEHAIFEDDHVDFIMIANDRTVEFEVPSYVKKLQRDNVGYDFGGWSDAILTSNLYEEYDKFIFVNSSVIGPFINTGKWTDVYLNRLTNDIKLVGSTINGCSTNPDARALPHVQSYIFAMDRQTLNYLIEQNIFSITDYAKTFDDAVWMKEVRMSRLVLERGWNIGCLLKIYEGVDWRVTPNCRLLDDIMYQPYLNIFWSEYELVFIKGNRVKYLTLRTK